jgi:hypothetical protein
MRHADLALTYYWQMGPARQQLNLILEKSYLFHMTFDEDDSYMKIVALDEIYNFLVLSFVI